VSGQPSAGTGAEEFFASDVFAFAVSFEMTGLASGPDRVNAVSVQMPTVLMVLAFMRVLLG